MNERGTLTSASFTFVYFEGVCSHNVDVIIRAKAVKRGLCHQSPQSEVIDDLGQRTETRF